MELKLPNSIGGKRDLILATRQVEQILSDRLQDDVRERYGAKRVGTKAGQQMLNQLLETNKLKDDTPTLKKMLQQLEGFKQHAPQIRIAFSQEPDQDLYQRVVSWFRSEIHPGVLVQIGVQPTIGGGFTLQTPMRRYDFSLKTRILSSTPKFLEILKRSQAPVPAPAPVASAPVPTEDAPDATAEQNPVPDPEPADEQPQPLTADPDMSADPRTSLGEQS